MPTDLSLIAQAPDRYQAARRAAYAAAADKRYTTKDAEGWGYAVADLLLKAGWRLLAPGTPTPDQSAEALAHAVHLLRPSDHYPADVNGDQVLVTAHRFARFLAGHPDEAVAIVPLEALRDVLGLVLTIEGLDAEGMASVAKLQAAADPDRATAADLDEEPF